MTLPSQDWSIRPDIKATIDKLMKKYDQLWRNLEMSNNATTAPIYYLRALERRVGDDEIVVGIWLDSSEHPHKPFSAAWHKDYPVDLCGDNVVSYHSGDLDQMLAFFKQAVAMLPNLKILEPQGLSDLVTLFGKILGRLETEKSHENSQPL